MIAFLDISPNDIYLTFIHNLDFEFGLERPKKTKKGYKIIKYGVFVLNNKIINCHFRGKDNSDEKATGAGYKVDFKLKDLEKVNSLEEINLSFQKCIKDYEIEKRKIKNRTINKLVNILRQIKMS